MKNTLKIQETRYMSKGRGGVRVLDEGKKGQEKGRTLLSQGEEGRGAGQ